MKKKRKKVTAITRSPPMNTDPTSKVYSINLSIAGLGPHRFYDSTNGVDLLARFQRSHIVCGILVFWPHSRTTFKSALSTVGSSVVPKRTSRKGATPKAPASVGDLDTAINKSSKHRRLAAIGQRRLDPYRVEFRQQDLIRPTARREGSEDVCAGQDVELDREESHVRCGADEVDYIMSRELWP